jgi:hypothetical protein
VVGLASRPRILKFSEGAGETGYAAPRRRSSDAAHVHATVRVLEHHHRPIEGKGGCREHVLAADPTGKQAAVALRRVERGPRPNSGEQRSGARGKAKKREVYDKIPDVSANGASEQPVHAPTILESV